MTVEERRVPAPVRSPETAVFWDAVTEGRFLVKHCEDCGENHFYPRDHCPFCFSARTAWLACRGTGRIHSFSVVRTAPKPYTIAYVTLDEGPALLTNIVGIEPGNLRIGDRVELVATATVGDDCVAMFRPAGAQAG